MTTVIIGAGAAGMAAAVAAARQGKQVLVLERGRQPLRKLAASGNGRGNLLNAGPPRYHGGEAFAREVLARQPYETLRAFWQSVGVPLAEEAEGRVYPASRLASVAAEGLAQAAKRLGVRVQTDTEAIAVQPCAQALEVHALRAIRGPDTVLKSGRRKPGPVVRQEPCLYAAGQVIVATGGPAWPALGAHGGGYALLSRLGHRIIPPRPALCALITDPGPLKGLEGLRVRAALSLLDAAGETLCQSEGEALFAADGVSGIAAMQLAREVRADCTLRLDLRRAVMGTQGDAADWLAKREGETLGARLTGAAAPALAHALLDAAGLRATDAPVPKALEALGRAIECFEVAVSGTRGMEAAQVTAGGADTREFDPADLQSRLVKGVHAAGEVLDVDGDCGGYNLMFAVASGLAAGQAK